MSIPVNKERCCRYKFELGTFYCAPPKRLQQNSHKIAELSSNCYLGAIWCLFLIRSHCGEITYGSCKIHCSFAPIKPRRKTKGAGDNPAAKAGLWKAPQSLPKGAHPPCTQLLQEFSGARASHRNLGTLSSALTSSTYVVFKRHFKTKGWAKNLGEAFDHSQHGRSYVAFPVSAIAGNTAVLLPLYVFISKETYAQNSNERIYILHSLGFL